MLAYLIQIVAQFRGAAGKIEQSIKAVYFLRPLGTVGQIG
jgi:hypothetical protein